MMQAFVFQKERLISINGNKTHQRRKIGKQINPNKKNKKQICTEGASENLMQQIPWETERK